MVFFLEVEQDRGVSPYDTSPQDTFPVGLIQLTACEEITFEKPSNETGETVWWVPGRTYLQHSCNNLAQGHLSWVTFKEIGDRDLLGGWIPDRFVFLCGGTSKKAEGFNIPVGYSFPSDSLFPLGKESKMVCFEELRDPDWTKGRRATDERPAA